VPTTRIHTSARAPIQTRVTRRLFLVAGSAGSGKSTLAKALAYELDAGWLQLDSIWLAMKVAAGTGTPAHDLLDVDLRMRREEEADEDVLVAHIAASGEVCRALPKVLGLELEAHERLVVDGAWLLPSTPNVQQGEEGPRSRRRHKIDHDRDHGAGAGRV
jgi:2-phosphoglycerate kinase